MRLKETAIFHQAETPKSVMADTRRCDKAGTLKSFFKEAALRLTTAKTRIQKRESGVSGKNATCR